MINNINPSHKQVIITHNDIIKTSLKQTHQRLKTTSHIMSSL